MALSATADANLDDEYRSVWREVADEKAGPYDGYAGRNLARYGVNLESGKVRDATRAELRDGLAVMGRMLNPVAVAVAAPAVEAEPTVATSSGGYAIPAYIVECESGGDYSASNPSGAFGAYQIMPGTAAAYGCDLSTPAGQDSCAGRIYAAEGSSPWVCG